MSTFRYETFYLWPFFFFFFDFVAIETTKLTHFTLFLFCDFPKQCTHTIHSVFDPKLKNKTATNKITYIANGKNHFAFQCISTICYEQTEERKKRERQQLGSWQTCNMIFFLFQRKWLFVVSILCFCVFGMRNKCE